jgi:hypothetical protein
MTSRNIVWRLHLEFQTEMWDPRSQVKFCKRTDDTHRLGSKEAVKEGAEVKSEKEHRDLVYVL